MDSWRIRCGRCGRFGRTPRVLAEVVFDPLREVASIRPQARTSSRADGRIGFAVSRPEAIVELLGDQDDVDEGVAAFRATCACSAIYEFMQKDLTAKHAEIMSRGRHEAIAGSDVGRLVGLEGVRGVVK